MEAYFCGAKPIQKYELYGVINHVGVLNGGHYYAYVKNYNFETNKHTDEWKICNDADIKCISENDVLDTRNAYMLFYKTMD